MLSAVFTGNRERAGRLALGCLERNPEDTLAWIVRIGCAARAETGAQSGRTENCAPLLENAAAHLRARQYDRAAAAFASLRTNHPSLNRAAAYGEGLAILLSSDDGPPTGQARVAHALWSEVLDPAGKGHFPSHAQLARQAGSHLDALAHVMAHEFLYAGDRLHERAYAIQTDDSPSWHHKVYFSQAAVLFYAAAYYLAHFEPRLAAFAYPHVEDALSILLYTVNLCAEQVTVRPSEWLLPVQEVFEVLDTSGMGKLELSKLILSVA